MQLISLAQRHAVCSGLVGARKHARELRLLTSRKRLIDGRHWIVPIIGSLPFGFALFIFFVSSGRGRMKAQWLTRDQQQGILTYLAMAYTKHAASALAANE
jgi:hypothetical protein